MMTRCSLIVLSALSLVCAAAVNNGAAAHNGAAIGGANREPTALLTAAAWMPHSGKASFYGPSFDGRRAADGSRFDQTAMTAAHPWLPFGTKVRVMLEGSSRSVIVTITDRIYSTRRIVDLSLGAARALGMIQQGIAQVTLAPA